MARRFGRNQRRQLKQQVARMEHDLHVTGTQYQKVSSEQRDLVKAFKSLLAELPEGSALKTELDRLAVYSNYMNGIQMAPHRPFQIGGVMDCGHLELLELVSLVAYRLRADPDLTYGRLRFSLDTADETAAWMVDRHYFETRGFSPNTVKELAERIARELTHYFHPEERSKRRGR